MTICQIDLDVSKPAEHIEMIQGRQGDTETVVRAAIYDDGVAYDFTGKYLEFSCIRPDGSWIRLSGPEVTHIGNTNQWDIKLPVQATASDGLIKIAFCTVKSNSDPYFRDSTNGFLIDLDKSATAEAHLGPYSDQVDKLLLYIEALIIAWEEQMAAQQAAYETAEKSRDSRYNQAEQKRNNQFDTAQTNRQNSYNSAEEDRNAKSDAAVNRANAAAAIVEAAFAGNFTPSIEEWVRVHLNKNEALGIFGYQEWLEAKEGLPYTEITDAEIDACIKLIGAN